MKPRSVFEIYIVIFRKKSELNLLFFGKSIMFYLNSGRNLCFDMGSSFSTLQITSFGFYIVANYR